MKDYQREFLDFAIECQALRFGEFTLKSGRVSPYFFNTGLFNTGGRLARLGRFYAQAIRDSGIAFDMLFGPAYKGVPLACAVAMALAEHGHDVQGSTSAAGRSDPQGRGEQLPGRAGAADMPYAFNRKEVKRYGEGGVVVGHPLQGKVLIIDDVISAGTSVRESVDIIRAGGAVPAGVVIAVDRQERGEGATSAVQEVEKMLGLRVTSIANLETLLAYLHGKGDNAQKHVQAIDAYRRKYGA